MLQNPNCSWATPVFVTAKADTSKNDVIDSLEFNCECDVKTYWAFKSDIKDGVNIYAFLLLNDFGDNKIVPKFISESLNEKLLNSLEMESITKSINAEDTNEILENKVSSLIRTVFMDLDNECYEAALKPILEEDKNSLQDWDDSASSLTSGCSAILALILNNRLFMANCGNAVGVLGVKIGGELAIFQVSETHDMISDKEVETSERNNVMEYLFWPPQRCFGDYGRKTEINKNDNKSKNAASAEPYIVKNIRLNRTVRFLLLLSPVTAKIVELLNPNDQPNAIISSMVIESMINDQECDIKSSLQSVLKRLFDDFLKKFGSSLGENDLKNFSRLSIAYLNLKNNENENELPNVLSLASTKTPATSKTSLDLETAMDVVENDTMSLNLKNTVDESENLNVVHSEVDWSEFYTHELHDTVLAKIESLKQYYRDCKSLGTIEENN